MRHKINQLLDALEGRSNEDKSQRIAEFSRMTFSNDADFEAYLSEVKSQSVIPDLGKEDFDDIADNYVRGMRF